MEQNNEQQIQQISTNISSQKQQQLNSNDMQQQVVNANHKVEQKKQQIQNDDQMHLQPKYQIQNAPLCMKDNMIDWRCMVVQLQTLLKQEYSLLSTEQQQKQTFQKKLNSIMMTYHRNIIHSPISFNSTPMTSQKDVINPKSSKDEKNIQKQKQKILQKQKKYSNQKRLLEDQGFGDSYVFIKQIVLSMSKDPQLMITLLKKHSTWNKSDSLESICRVIVNSMYQNIVDDDIYNKDYFYIIKEGFLMITCNIKHFYQIKFSNKDNLGCLLIKQFLQRSQIKTYVKQVVRNTLLQIAKLDHQISFQIVPEQEKDKPRKTEGGLLRTGTLKLQKVQSKKSQKHQKHEKHQKHQKNQSPIKDKKINPKSAYYGKSIIAQYAQALKNKDQKLKSSLQSSKSIQTKSKNKCVSADLLKFLGISDQVQFPVFINSKASSQLKQNQTFNKHYAAILNRQQSLSQQNSDIVAVKNIILIFFSDLFKMFYSLPLTLRISCKMLYNVLQRQYTTKKSCMYVLAEYILNLCLVQQINIDQNILESGKFGSHVKSNLQTVISIIKGVIRNDSKQIHKAFSYQFNLLTQNLRISIFNYLQEVLNINSQKISNFVYKESRILTQEQKSQNIKSYTVCLSVSDVKRLFQMIKISKKQLLQINKNDKLIKRVQRVQMMNEDNDIFGQKTDKTSGNIYKPQNSYVLFTQLQLPQQLSVDYMKYHSDAFKKQKLKNLLKQVFLNTKQLSLYLEFYKCNTFYDFVKNISQQASNRIGDQIQAIDHIPLQIRLKYLISLINRNSIKIQDFLNIMHNQAKNRLIFYKGIWDKSKQCYLKALSSVVFLNQVIVSNEQIIKKNIKLRKLDEFISKTKIQICITSPKTRQKQIVLRTNLMKDLPEQQKTKIWVQNQTRCIHTALNLQFIKSLTGQPQKVKKHECHCNSILKFTDVLCSLPEIKSNSAEDLGVKQCFFEFIKYCSDIILKKPEYSLLNQDMQWFEQNLQQKLSKRIYDKLYPKAPTYEDTALYLRLKTLSFVSYQHMKIQPSLRIQKMWQLAGRHLKMMDKVKTAGQKLHCIVQSSKIIVNSYYLISQKDQPATADDIYPIVIYILIKSAPRRLISNITFIQYFANQNKLMSKQGYFFTQLKSAIQFCDHLDQHGLELPGVLAQRIIQFNKNIYEQEIKYGIYFLLGRKKDSPRSSLKKLDFLKQFFQKVKSSSQSQQIKQNQKATNQMQK